MEEIRDYVLIVALIMYGLVGLALTLGLTLIAWKLLTGVRWLRRKHDDVLRPAVQTGAERVTALNTQMASGSGASELALAGFRLVQSKRKRRRKTRLQKAKELISVLRPG